MTKEELRDRFYVETGILEPFERLEEYMSWLEQNVIELSKLHQPTVISTVCECKNLPKGEIAISSKALSDPNWTDGQTDL